MSEPESETVSPEASCAAEQSMSREDIQTETEVHEDDDESTHEIKVDVCTATDMLLQEENLTELNKNQDDITQQGSESNQTLSSSDVGSSTATGETCLPQKYTLTKNTLVLPWLFWTWYLANTMFSNIMF